MNLTTAEIFTTFADSGVLSEHHGPDATVTGFAPAESYSAGDMVFLDDEQHIRALGSGAPAAVVTSPALAPQLTHLTELSVLIAEDVKLAHALVRQRYDDVDPHQTEWSRIHDSAVVHPSTQVPANVTIGPNAVVGSGVRLGQGVVIEAGAVVEHDVRIDDEALVQARVFIGHGCHIGKRVRLKPGCVVGAEGFGFARDRDKRWHRVPQKGRVVIEDDVLISANCTVDRATYGETRIRRGTKIDALCHIAHNVFLDEDCILVAQSGIAGSSRFGKRVIASGQTGVLDHKTVVDDVVMVHRCGVTEDITKPGMYATTPPQPFREYTRNIASFGKLFDLRQRLKRLEKQVAQLLKR